MPEISVKTAIGDSPNEVFLRTGQFVMALSVVSYLGISGFGVELAGHSTLAPIVSGSAGIFLMIFGAALRKRHLVEKQKHELRLEAAKAHLPHHELKHGDVKYLEFIGEQDLPIPERQLANTPFHYDMEKTADELRRALSVKRAMLLECAGHINRHNGSIDLSNKSDKTVIK